MITRNDNGDVIETLKVDMRSVAWVCDQYNIDEWLVNTARRALAAVGTWPRCVQDHFGINRDVLFSSSIFASFLHYKSNHVTVESVKGRFFFVNITVVVLLSIITVYYYYHRWPATTVFWQPVIVLICVCICSSLFHHKMVAYKP